MLYTILVGLVLGQSAVPPTPPPSCHGQAVVCSQFGADLWACQGQHGCKATHGCAPAAQLGCQARSDEHQCDAAGCSWRVACSGVASPCSTFAPDACDRQEGCTYNWRGQRCEGAATSCDSLANPISCVRRHGCSWRAHCGNTGGVTSCQRFGIESVCAAQMGCTWEARCEGMSSACEVLPDAARCSGQAGCYWK